MAIYHCSIKIISRGKGRSAVAAAAYRAGEKITSEYDGTIHDYTRKGGVVHTEILLPDHAPAGFTDRAVLWNAVEKIEKTKNAQLAREIEIALPTELTREQNISLAREYVNRHFVAAHSYLKGVMNGKTTLPTKAWKAEYAKLTAERKTLNQRYLTLKNEVKEAEQIRKSVYSILRQEQRERQIRRMHDINL